MRRIAYFHLLVLMLLMWSSVVSAQDVEGEMMPTPEVLEPTIIVTNPNIPTLMSARSDLDLLANNALGTERPEGWSGVREVSNPQLAVLLRLDLEILAGALLGLESRPDGWFGAVSSTSYAIARDIRHDLELLADATVGANIRPPGWTGADPIMRCNRSTQAIVTLLEKGGYLLETDAASLRFCDEVEVEVSRYLEGTLEHTGVVLFGGQTAVRSTTGEVVVNSDRAIAFLDRHARQRAGIIPNATVLRPVARSYTQFSNMMVVRGEGFELFVDYTYTTMPAHEFNNLPNFENLPITPICAVEWCTG